MLKQVCSDFGLSTSECKELKAALSEICMVVKKKKKSKRAPSDWQRCIAKERAGKPFDPKALKDLSKLYKAGKCP